MSAVSSSAAVHELKQQLCKSTIAVDDLREELLDNKVGDVEPNLQQQVVLATTF